VRSGTLQRTVLWRNLFMNGSDYCSLWKSSEAWILEGTAIAALDEHRPLIARYEVGCDLEWHTRRVTVERTSSDVRALTLAVEPSGLWHRDGEEVRELRGLLDVDLAITPATNTLPIRRLNLAIGQGAEVTAAWIKLPDLAVEALHQTYTRLSPDRYRYESSTGFSAEITVDEFGLVKSYPGGWERLSQL